MTPPAVATARRPPARLVHLDFFRAVCVCAVVIEHSTQDPSKYNVAFVQHWVLPFLFLISGQCWAMSRQSIFCYAARLLVYFVVGTLLNLLAILIKPSTCGPLIPPSELPESVENCSALDMYAPPQTNGTAANGCRRCDGHWLVDGWNDADFPYALPFQMYYVLSILLGGALVAPFKWAAGVPPPKRPPPKRRPHSDARLTLDQDLVEDDDDEDDDAEPGAGSHSKLIVFCIWSVILVFAIVAWASGFWSILLVFLSSSYEAVGADPRRLLGLYFFESFLIQWATSLLIYINIHKDLLFWFVWPMIYVPRAVFPHGWIALWYHEVDLFLLGWVVQAFSAKWKRACAFYMKAYWPMLFVVPLAILTVPGMKGRWDTYPPGSPKWTAEELPNQEYNVQQMNPSVMLVRVVCCEALIVLYFLFVGESTCQDPLGVTSWLTTWALLNYMWHMAVHRLVPYPFNYLVCFGALPVLAIVDCWQKRRRCAADDEDDDDSDESDSTGTYY